MSLRGFCLPSWPALIRNNSGKTSRRETQEKKSLLHVDDQEIEKKKRNHMAERETATCIECVTCGTRCGNQVTHMLTHKTDKGSRKHRVRRWP